MKSAQNSGTRHEIPESNPQGNTVAFQPAQRSAGCRAFLALWLSMMVWFANAVGAAPPTELTTAIQEIRRVGTEGRGNVEAAAAWNKLAAAGPASLVLIIRGMDDANELAINWLRAAVEVIADREFDAGRKLPVEELVQFLSESTHDPKGRRLAFELIRRQDPARAELLLAGMVKDSSLELRREAVERIMVAGAAARNSGARTNAVVRYRQALNDARDPDQIEALAKILGELGEAADLASVFGWISRWQVIGPFDSTAGKGFEAVYPPEHGFDAQAEYDGKAGKVRWMTLVTTNEYGTVDFNRPLGKLKGVVGYARTEFLSDAARPVEVRLGTENAWKVWLNGRLLLAHEEYHRAAAIDQFRLSDTLRPGRNVLLVKLCQNEQTQDWADAWEFQLRITDDLGTPVVVEGRVTGANDSPVKGREISQ